MVPQQKVLRGKGTPTNGRGPLSRPMIWECKDLKEVMEGSMQEWEVHRSSQHGDKVGACLVHSGIPGPRLEPAHMASITLRRAEERRS